MHGGLAAHYGETINIVPSKCNFYIRICQNWGSESEWPVSKFQLSCLPALSLLGSFSFSEWKIGTS